MKILVCIKQVPDSTVRVKVAPDGRSIITDGINWAMSAYDEYALELALETKDADPGTTVSVVTVGPARARDVLRAALAMGADDAILVTGATAESLGGLRVARALAKVVTERAPDLVLAGRQSSDDDAGLVGPALAEALGWPHLSMVTGFDGKTGEVTREVDGGFESWRTSGPAVFAVHRSAKEPRYPSLPGIMKAKKKEIPELDAATLLDEAAGGLPRLEVVTLEPPPVRGAGKMVQGDAREAAVELARLLREEAKVLS